MIKARISFSTKAYLHFAEGPSFPGWINCEPDDPRVRQGLWGEAAFTTGMTGYQETITDPSFLGQHIIFSSPHIGNYPPDQASMQSLTTHATAILAPYFSPNTFFKELDVPLMRPMDTRALVKYLVSGKGHHISVLSTSSTFPDIKEFGPHQLFCNQLEKVSVKTPQVLTPGKRPIVVIDYGSKFAILNNLKELHFPLVVLGPWATLKDITSYNPCMVFLSNGPGDPSFYQKQILVVREILQTKIPVRAICLGHQLVGLALGAKTYRLPFGHRGCNHPVLNHLDGKVLITSQNHGYALDSLSLAQLSKKNFLEKEFFVQYSSLFDQSIEGISSVDHSVKTVQFHPEASPGPMDACTFFQEIKDYLTSPLSSSQESISINIKTKDLHIPIDLKKGKPQITIPYKKILVIGSGPIKIGQASEFDYSGTQACRVLKAEGIEAILLNSNPATIMTDREVASRTYIEPITVSTVKKIIEMEKVDTILSTMGGQTALNLCLELDKEGYLEKNHITLLGANCQTILKTEDRDLFSQELDTLGYKTGKRTQVYSQEEAITKAAQTVGYPLIIRRNFALGGQGALIVNTESELKSVFSQAQELKFPITLEKSLQGYKEIELEIMIDREQNGVIICSIENVDPCGVHTGDSITVAPAQTISDRCYQKLRTMALNIGKLMGVVAGGANVQFAIHPDDENDIVVIEMNPRVSRSSALASKATGYPIAKISTLLALGYTLKDILNDITKSSPVSFEPTLDYVAVKIPLFPFDKFPFSSCILGPQMRSVGEVLSIGSNFAEAFMKALRSLELNLEVPSLSQLKGRSLHLTTVEEIESRLEQWQELSLLTVIEAIRLGIPMNRIQKLSLISPWFIDQMEEWVSLEKEIKTLGPKEFFDHKERFLSYKSQGFSDKYMALLLGLQEEEIFQYRLKNAIFPSFNAVDTCSGEFPVKTPYFYSTYQKQNEIIPFSREPSLSKTEIHSVMIIGSGPNRIGQGIEFDYSCVKAAKTLTQENIKSIMVNSNPETVSTDYDSSDRLYLSPLYAEDVFDILFFEKPWGLIASFSGQTGIQIRRDLETTFRQRYQQTRFLGPKWESIERTEDRKRFEEVLKCVNIQKTKSLTVRGFDELVKACDSIGYPVIIRPNFVIGGESMFIFTTQEDIMDLPPKTLNLLQRDNMDFLVENYLENAHEYDVDLVRDHRGNCIFTLCEHIEFAGVHSGDSGMITPPVYLSHPLFNKLKETSIKLAGELDIIGPINFQFAVKNQQIYCIEANPRGSRTLPFLSKAYSLSLPHYAVLSMLGKEIPSFAPEKTSVFCVKQSTFPFDRFLEDNSLLGPKMRSTGETMGIDPDRDQAILKSYMANFPRIRSVGKILLSLADQHKTIISPYLKTLYNMGYQFYATKGTYEFIRRHGLPSQMVARIGEPGKTILQILQTEDIVMVFNTPTNERNSCSDGENIRNMSIQKSVACFTRPENIKAVMESIIGCQNESSLPLCLQELPAWNI